MDSLILLDDARAAGLSVEVKGNTLVVRGPRRAKAVALELLAHKQEIMECLKEPPVAWKGSVDEYSRLLIFKQAELEIAKASVTGEPRADWYIQNRILNLETQIADLTALLRRKIINEEEGVNQ